MKTTPTLAEAKPDLCKEWNYEKNGGMTPSDVTPGSNKKVWWTCAKGHDYQARIAHRSTVSGCPCCAGKKACADNCLATLEPGLAGEWHPEKNQTLTPHDVTPQSGKAAIWLCTRGHEWKSTINNRTNGRGCPYCGGKKVCTENCLATLEPGLAGEWHPEKNRTLTPNDVTTGSNTKAWWICPKGHEYQARISHRSAGSNCPHCNLSKGEEAVRKTLKSLNVKFKSEFPLKKREGGRSLRFDFAVGVGLRRGLIEYHGIQHYQSVDAFGGQAAFLKVQQRDHAKRALCQRLGLPLLEIPYWDFENINDLVAEFIQSMS